MSILPGLVPPSLPPVELGLGPIGVIADVHANIVALDAVLEHARLSGVSQWLVLGDTVAMGPNPAEVVQRLEALDPAILIRGNTERYVLHGSQPQGPLSHLLADASRLPGMIEVAESFAWTRGFLTATGQLAHLDRYVPSARLLLPDGTRILATHASLRSDEGRGISPDVSELEMAQLFPNPQADLVLGGHTHRRTDTVFGAVRYLNPGSISNNPTSNEAAEYSVINAGVDGHSIENHTVAYDTKEAVNAISRSRIPGADYLINRYFKNHLAPTP